MLEPTSLAESSRIETAHRGKSVCITLLGAVCKTYLVSKNY
jgi:hypothetical protein